MQPNGAWIELYPYEMRILIEEYTGMMPVLIRKQYEFIVDGVLCSTHPFTLPAVSPCTKNRWQKTKITITGMSVSTDMANTYPHCVN